jgi:NitT/TauT family transport system permease protein
VIARLMQPLAGFALVLLTWHFTVTLLQVDPLILPPLTEVLAGLYRGVFDGLLLPHLWATVQGAFAGFLLGGALAFVLAVLLAELTIAARFIYPVIVALQAMPVVAIAPLLIVWLGIGIASKVFMAALVAFFPVFVNTFAGVQSVRPELLDLYRSCGASRWRTLRDVKVPSALTLAFTGLQIAAVLSLTGCVVAEFIAARAGLGYFIKALSSQLDVTMMFAAVLMLAAIGTCAGLAIKGLQRTIVFWEGRGRS